jgi:hypothetical protein
MSSDKGRAIVNQFERLKKDRFQLEDYWADAFALTYPNRGQALINHHHADTMSRINNSQSDQARIFDTTAVEAVRTLAAALKDGLAPSNTIWFTLKAFDELLEEDLDQESKEYLENAANLIFKMYNASNFNSQAYEFFVDIAIAGQAGLFQELILDDPQSGGLHFELWPLETLYVQSVKSRGEIDAVYRIVQFSPSEAVDKFGIKSLPAPMKVVLDENPNSDKQFDFIHVIRPRITKTGKQATGKLGNNMPFESVYVFKADGMIVFEGGFQEFPVVIPRWLLVPGTDYATGPVNEALPDIKTLNKVQEMQLSNQEMAIAGTFVASDDGVLNPNTVRIGPRRIIMAESVDSIRALTSSGDFRIGFESIDRLTASIRRLMLSDLLEPLEKANVTATEVRTRVQTIRRLLGPVFSRLETEFLVPLLFRSWNLLRREGLIGEPPDQIAGALINPVFLSPQAMAQKLEKVDQIAQFEGALQVAAGVRPEVLDVYDMDQALRMRADLLGVPAELVRDAKATGTIRDAALEAQLEQAQATQGAGLDAQGGALPSDVLQTLNN